MVNPYTKNVCCPQKKSAQVRHEVFRKETQFDMPHFVAPNAADTQSITERVVIANYMKRICTELVSLYVTTTIFQFLR
jgi:hypothetical protein